MYSDSTLVGSNTDSSREMWIVVVGGGRVICLLLWLSWIMEQSLLSRLWSFIWPVQSDLDSGQACLSHCNLDLWIGGRQCCLLSTHPHRCFEGSDVKCKKDMPSDQSVCHSQVDSLQLSLHFWTCLLSIPIFTSVSVINLTAGYTVCSGLFCCSV